MATETLYQGSFLDLRRERVLLPNGRQTELELLCHPGAAAVVALAADGEVVMVRQFRHATGGWLLEIPAGKLDEGEQAEACARRELAEETGFSARRWNDLGWIWTSPGFTDERIRLFLARDLEPARQALEDDELLTVERLPFKRAVAMAAGGEIEDSKSVCALLRSARHLDDEEGRKR